MLRTTRSPIPMQRSSVTEYRSASRSRRISRRRRDRRCPQPRRFRPTRPPDRACLSIASRSPPRTRRYRAATGRRSPGFTRQRYRVRPRSRRAHQHRIVGRAHDRSAVRPASSAKSAPTARAFASSSRAVGSSASRSAGRAARRARVRRAVARPSRAARRAVRQAQRGRRHRANERRARGVLAPRRRAAASASSMLSCAPRNGTEIRALRHEADLRAAQLCTRCGIERRQRRSGDHNLACGREIEPGEQVQERRLARA